VVQIALVAEIFEKMSNETTRRLVLGNSESIVLLNNRLLLWKRNKNYQVTKHYS